MTFCDEGLRILMEELRSLPELDLEGLADGAGGCRLWDCGTGTRDVDVTVGLVMVVDWGPKWVTEVPWPGDVECIVVVVYGPCVVVVVVDVVDEPSGLSPLPRLGSIAVQVRPETSDQGISWQENVRSRVASSRGVEGKMYALSKLARSDGTGGGLAHCSVSESLQCSSATG
jgi:hypothetical protein